MPITCLVFNLQLVAHLGTHPWKKFGSLLVDLEWKFGPKYHIDHKGELKVIID